MRTEVARNLASLLARILTDWRYARDAFFYVADSVKLTNAPRAWSPPQLWPRNLERDCHADKSHVDG